METIRTRCPSCNKLYSVDPHLIKSSRPQFECLSCQTRFFFDFPYAQTLATTPIPEPLPSDLTDRLSQLGLPQDFTESPRHSEAAKQFVPRAEVESIFEPRPPSSQNEVEAAFTRECPKCHALNRQEAQECASCGIVFQKYWAWKQEGEHWQHLNKKISEAWQSVLNDYDYEPAHTLFLERCLEAGELPVAARHYQKMLEMNPNDELALEMTRRLNQLAQVQLPISRIVTWPSWRTSFFSFIILVGTLLAVTGFTVPWARNLIGVGVSLIFTAVGARFYARYLM